MTAKKKPVKKSKPDNPLLLKATISLGDGIVLKFLAPGLAGKATARELISRSVEVYERERESEDSGERGSLRSDSERIESEIEKLLLGQLTSVEVDGREIAKGKESVIDAGHLRGGLGFRILNAVCFRDWANDDLTS